MKIVHGKKLTSREVARLLGVSEASVKRWADGGLLRAEKTAGGHRRFRPEAVAAFRRAQEAGRAAAAPAEALNETPRAAGEWPPPPSADADAADAPWEKLFAALIEGRSEEASAMLASLCLHGQSIASVADSTLCTAMRHVGDLWEAGELSVAEEHVATRTALDALLSLRGASPQREPTNLSALCCSVEEDFHELPVHLAALVLEAEGWEAISLGTSTPFYALAEAMARFRPRLVCVTATMITQLDRAAREYVDFRAAAVGAGAAVVLGGAGFAGETLRRRFPAEYHADSFVGLQSFIASLGGGDEARA
jgi:excisionase family DNA binding protein